MSSSERSLVAGRVIDRFGTPFVEEAGCDIESDEPSNLFGMLVFALLASARIRHDVAVKAAKALREAGWTTAEKMRDAAWESRTKVLNKAGYARYDESTSRYLGETAALLMDEYGGDLRKLREKGERDPAGERELLKTFKGIGDGGADIFFREAQAVWEELYPFADKRALEAAGTLGLGSDAKELAKAVRGRARFVRLAAGLVRCDLEDGYDEIDQGS